MKQNYFQSEETCFEQKEGTAMDSPLPPILAKLLRRRLETDFKNKQWLGYFGDIFAVLDTIQSDR